MLSLISIAALLAGQVAAHGVVNSVTANGKTYQGFDPSDLKDPASTVGWKANNQDTGFVSASDVNKPDIICHKGATAAQAYVEVTAGSKVGLHWKTWPDSHKGPMLDYLAECTGGDCTKVDKTQLKFFKIDGVGMIKPSNSYEPGQYADDVMMANGNKWEVTIPADIKPGSYVLRHETIALHEGQRVGGAQMYPQCINLKITGSGTATPAGVPGTQLYQPNEKGIVFDVYKPYKLASDYPVPGPAVYGSGASTGTTAAPAAAPATANNVVTDATSAVTKASTSSGSTYAPASVSSDDTSSDDTSSDDSSDDVVDDSTSDDSNDSDDSSSSSGKGKGKGKGRGRGRWSGKAKAKWAKWGQDSKSSDKRRHPRDFSM